MHTTHQPILPSLQRLAVYARALEFTTGVHSLPVQGSLRDQLYRAAESVTLNVAEGAGSIGLAGKSKYWGIARASLWETAAALDLLALRLGPKAEIARLGSLAREVDAMLAALARRR